MGDLLFDVIASGLRERGLQSQAAVSAFVRDQVGWKIPQQAISKIINKQFKNPRQSTHVLALLFALGRDASGKPRRAAAAELQEEVLRDCITGLEEGLAGAALAPDTKASVVISCYRSYIADGQMPSRAVILEFVRHAKSQSAK